jgi:choline dehydrogenase-like flavoprotein
MNGREATDADVVVVGAGFAGAALCKRLSERGARVICLEQGPWIGATDRPHETDEWEFGFTRDWSWNPNVRRLPQDYPVVTDDVNPFLYNAVGGSSNHYAGFWHRLHPSDFRKGSEHGLEGTIDWPIGYEDLEPYYELNDREVGVSGVAGDPAHPVRAERQCRPLSHGRYSSLMAAGFEKLGWHWWPADNAIISEPYDGRLACNNCVLCMAGCPRGSLGEARTTYWPKALKNGVDLRANARVERLVLGPNGRVKSAIYVDRVSQTRHELEARTFVIASNSIGTPRILLNSACPEFPDGLANRNGMVGKHLMHHGYVLLDAWFREETEQYKGPFGAAVFSQEFYETDRARGAVNGMTLTVGGGYGPATSALGGTVGRARAPWGERHHAEWRRRFNHDVFIAVQTEDLPCERNRVTLDPESKDADGIPAARISYRLHENDRKLLAFGVERAKDAALAAGAFEVDATSFGEDYRPPGWHLMGTCRMGSSPNDSVIDRDHRSWDVPNLFLCDGSSMPTGGAGNPTSTIGALALRCADRIWETRQEL